MSLDSSKKTVTIPATLICSLLIGIIISLLAGLLVHLCGKNSFAAYPDPSIKSNIIPMTASAYSYGFTCSLGKSHWYKDDKTTMDDVIGGHFSGTKWNSYTKAVYDGHWGFLLTVFGVSSLIVYILFKYRFKLE